MDAKQLTIIYPQLDLMMAETLIAAHEAGTLQGYLNDWEDPSPPRPATSKVLSGAVVFKSAPSSIDEGLSH